MGVEGYIQDSGSAILGMNGSAGGDFSLSWTQGGTATWTGTWGTYSPTAGTFTNTSTASVYGTGTLIISAKLRVCYVIYQQGGGYQTYEESVLTPQQTVTVTSPPKRKSDAGSGGVKVAVTDLSSYTGWSGITEIPVSVEVEVPEGTQIDNVVVTASVQTAADYMAQPYSDPNHPSDFSMTWTPLTGNPSWGWSGTSDE